MNKNSLIFFLKTNSTILISTIIVIAILYTNMIIQTYLYTIAPINQTIDNCIIIGCIATLTINAILLAAKKHYSILPMSLTLLLLLLYAYIGIQLKQVESTRYLAINTLVNNTTLINWR